MSVCNVHTCRWTSHYHKFFVCLDVTIELGQLQMFLFYPRIGRSDDRHGRWTSNCHVCTRRCPVNSLFPMKNNITCYIDHYFWISLTWWLEALRRLQSSLRQLQNIQAWLNNFVGIIRVFLYIYRNITIFNADCLSFYHLWQRKSYIAANDSIHIRT